MYISANYQMSFGSKRVPVKKVVNYAQPRLSQKAAKHIDYVKKLIKEADESIIKMNAEKVHNATAYESAHYDALIGEMSDYSGKLRLNIESIKILGDGEISDTKKIIKEHLENVDAIENAWNSELKNWMSGKDPVDMWAMSVMYGDNVKTVR